LNPQPLEHRKGDSQHGNQGEQGIERQGGGPQQALMQREGDHKLMHEPDNCIYPSRDAAGSLPVPLL